jgi:hypothetical protein
MISEFGSRNHLSNYQCLKVLVKIAALPMNSSIVSRKLAFGPSISLRIWTTSN